MGVNKAKNKQFLITVSNELLKEIEDYKFENRIPNRTEAIRELLKRGLEKG